MTNQHDDPDTTSLSPTTFRVLVGGTIAVLIFVVASVIIGGGDEPQREDSTPPVAKPRTAAKPTDRLEAIDGCGKPDDKDVDALLNSLGDDPGSVELSATWTGGENGDKRTVIALMVRSAQGTIDQPHLIWLKDGDRYTAITKDTAEASSTDSDLTLAASEFVAAGINCLTAGSR